MEPTIRCKINLAKKCSRISKIHAIQNDPHSGNIFFVDTPYYNEILYQLHSGRLELNVRKDYFGSKKEPSFELFESIVSTIEKDYDAYKPQGKKEGPFETTVYDNLESYKKDQA